MAGKNEKTKRYADLDDLEKLAKQWHKLTGLHSREEWSAAVIRAATAAEIAANFAIRNEFAERSEFDSDFVNDMLRWANGLAGKIDKLLIPLSAERKELSVVPSLKRLAETINSERNKIAHQGNFCSEKKAKEIVEGARRFIETLVRIYEPKFRLKDQTGK